MDDAHTPQGLKLQVALAPLVPAGLAAGGAAILLGGAPRLAALGLAPLALLLVLGLPLVVRCLVRDPLVGLAAPLFVLLRALALAAGLAAGLVAELRGGVLAPDGAAGPEGGAGKGLPGRPEAACEGSSGRGAAEGRPGSPGGASGTLSA